MQTKPYLSLSMKDVKLPEQISTPEGSLHATIGASRRLDDGTKE